MSKHIRVRVNIYFIYLQYLAITILQVLVSRTQYTWEGFFIYIIIILNKYVKYRKKKLNVSFTRKACS